jgi:hypothetical protein
MTQSVSATTAVDAIVTTTTEPTEMRSAETVNQVTADLHLPIQPICAGTEAPVATLEDASKLQKELAPGKEESALLDALEFYAISIANMATRMTPMDAQFADATHPQLATLQQTHVPD